MLEQNFTGLPILSPRDCRVSHNSLQSGFQWSSQCSWWRFGAFLGLLTFDNTNNGQRMVHQNHESCDTQIVSRCKTGRLLKAENFTNFTSPVQNISVYTEAFLVHNIREDQIAQGCHHRLPVSLEEVSQWPFSKLIYCHLGHQDSSSWFLHILPHSNLNINFGNLGSGFTSICT